MIRTDHSFSLDTVICGRCGGTSKSVEERCPHCGADRDGAIFTSGAEPVIDDEVPKRRLRNWLVGRLRKRLVGTYPSIREAAEGGWQHDRKRTSAGTFVLVGCGAICLFIATFFYMQADPPIRQAHESAAQRAAGSIAAAPASAPAVASLASNGPLPATKPASSTSVAAVPVTKPATRAATTLAASPPTKSATPASTVLAASPAVKPAAPAVGAPATTDVAAAPVTKPAARAPAATALAAAPAAKPSGSESTALAASPTAGAAGFAAGDYGCGCGPCYKTRCARTRGHRSCCGPGGEGLRLRIDGARCVPGG